MRPIVAEHDTECQEAAPTSGQIGAPAPVHSRRARVRKPPIQTDLATRLEPGGHAGGVPPLTMDASAVPMLVVLGVLLVCSGLASASETAFFGIGHARRALLRDEHPVLGAMVDRLLATPRRLLLQVLLLNMSINVAYFIVSSVLTLRAEGAVWRIGISVGSVFAIILIGEVVAKLAAVLAPGACLRVLAPLQLAFRGPLRPLIALLDTWFILPTTRLVAPGPAPERGVSAEEMGVLLEMGAREGVIDRTEQDLLSSIVTLSRRRVGEIMRPRVDFAWIDADASPDEILALSVEHGRTHFPVFEGGIDGRVLGVVDATRVLDGLALRDAITPVHVVPEQATLDGLLEQFRATERTIALCVDEHGTVVGLVTLSDLADQLVERVSDEGPDDEGTRIERVGEQSWLVPGQLSVREWNAFFGVSSAASRARTLAGLIMHELGRLPSEGDTVDLGTLALRVREMDGRRVRLVEVRLATPEGGGAAP